MFATAGEARHFLVERIGARATAEGSPLSDSERQRLNYSEFEPQPPLDSKTQSACLDSDDFEEEFEARIAGLLRQAYDLDASDATARQMYWDALGTLAGGDHYVNWIAERAGLRPPMPQWLRPFKQTALFALLVFPALVAILMAGAGIWAAFGDATRSTEEAIAMSVVVLMFGAFAAFLLGLWVRERRE